MEENFPHLPLHRELPVNEKRPGGHQPARPPSNVARHVRGLQKKLADARKGPAPDLGGFDDRRLFQFSVGRGFNPEDLRKISGEIEYVSQEGENVVIGFASEEALDHFEARLSTLENGGHVTNRQVIFALQGIDSLHPEDRQGWALKARGFPESKRFFLDVELWPLEDNSENRVREQDEFEKWVQQQGIEQKDQVKQTELTLYRVECDIEQAEQLLRHRDVRCVDLPPDFGLERSFLFPDIQNIPEIDAPGEKVPGVAILDSGLATNHPLLAAAVGDAQSFLPGDDGAHDENGHGTHVAGLALYGDFEKSLRNGHFIPELRLYSGRILDKDNESTSGLVENQVDEAVRYFVNHYQCRIFNLSFGDANKPYFGGHLKGLSVILDLLSRELEVLFVVSAGNHQICDGSPDGLAWRDNYPDYLLGDAWRIIEPAPALNVLTIGSLAHRNQTWNSQAYPLDPSELPIARPGQPSPFTRCGFSVDEAIKPELVAPGGNWAINTRMNNSLIRSNAGLGVVSTYYKFAEGKPVYADTGTSMSAPQVAHLAGRMTGEYPDLSINLVRALLCLNAEVPQSSQTLIERDKRFRRACGYGQVNDVFLYRSLENSVTLIVEESIEDKTHHFYEIPIPEEFTAGGNRRAREIAVALAHVPPVRSTRIKYRASRIDFRLVSAQDLKQVATMFNKATEKNDYENIPEISKAAIGKKARSKGTVQADSWRFRQFTDRSKLRMQKLFLVITRNDFPWGRSLCESREKYSLAVSIRDRENGEARLYSAIRAELEARQRMRVQVGR